MYEIVWGRLLVFTFGGITFAITTVLSCVMGGLALGSYLAGRLINYLKKPKIAYGILENSNWIILHHNSNFIQSCNAYLLFVCKYE